MSWFFLKGRAGAAGIDRCTAILIAPDACLGPVFTFSPSGGRSKTPQCEQAGAAAVAQPLHHGGADTHAARLQGGKQGVLKGIFGLKPLLDKRKQL